MWVKFVVGLSFVSRGFSAGTLVSPSPQKPTLPNSNSTMNQVDEEPLCGCATSKINHYFIVIVIIVIFLPQNFFILRIASP